MGGEGIIGAGFWCAGTYSGDTYLPFCSSDITTLNIRALYIELT
jgi:hypothetical protein